MKQARAAAELTAETVTAGPALDILVSESRLGFGSPKLQFLSSVSELSVLSLGFFFWQVCHNIKIDA